MSVNTNGNGQIQRRPAGGGQTLAGLLTNMQSEIARALPKHMTPDRMARVALTALRTTKGLAEVSPASFAACIMTAAQLGLEPNTPLGHAYLIPRRIKGSQQCTLILGYQGLLELARRSGQVKGIWANAVYEGDRFHVAFGLAPTIIHEPDFMRPRTAEKLTHVYAAASLAGSDQPAFVVLTRAEIELARRRGASGQGHTTPWDTDYEIMALKTAVRRLYKWLPKSIEMATAASIDEAHERGVVVADSIVREAVERQGYELPEQTVDEAPDFDAAEEREAVQAEAKKGEP